MEVKEDEIRRFQFLGIPPKGERQSWAVKEVGRKFPISRDPPEGGTETVRLCTLDGSVQRFQFLGIPPKGEPLWGPRWPPAQSPRVSNF